MELKHQKRRKKNESQNHHFIFTLFGSHFLFHAPHAHISPSPALCGSSLSVSTLKVFCPLVLLSRATISLSRIVWLGNDEVKQQSQLRQHQNENSLYHLTTRFAIFSSSLCFVICVPVNVCGVSIGVLSKKQHRPKEKIEIIKLLDY